MTAYNSPGAPANPPQHILTEAELPPGGDLDHPRPTHDGPDDDPHPSDEERPYRARNPGRADRPVEARQIGPNDAIHNGTPPPRPRNAETD